MVVRLPRAVDRNQAGDDGLAGLENVEDTVVREEVGVEEFCWLSVHKRRIRGEGKQTRDEIKVIRRARADVVLLGVEAWDVAVDALQHGLAACVGCVGVDIGGPRRYASIPHICRLIYFLIPSPCM